MGKILQKPELEGGFTSGTSNWKTPIKAGAVSMTSYTEADGTTGMFTSRKLVQTMSDASTTNTVEVDKVVLESDVVVGDWANAHMAQIDFKDSGSVTGLAGVSCAELDMPAKTVAAGEYAAFEAEINGPTSYVANGRPVYGFLMNLWGAAVTELDKVGHLFGITGATSGATSMWYDHDGTAGGDTVNEWIKIKTPNGDKWLAVYDSVH